MQTLELDLPDFWLPALVNGDEDGYSPEDLAAITDFTSWMLETYGQCWCIGYEGDGDDFRSRHDASRFGVLACNVVTCIFDITNL